MRKLLYTAIITLVAMFGLTFAYKNHQSIAIEYYFGVRFQAELTLLLFGAFALGLLGGALATLVNAMTTRHRLSRAQRQIRTLQSAAS